MDKYIVETFNNMLEPDDDLYVLGDLVLGEIEEGFKALSLIDARIHIICGNHDTSAKIERYKTLPNVVSIDYALPMKISKRKIFYLSHYRTETANDNDSVKVYNLHGHTHSKEKFSEDMKFCYNCALDAHDCKPVSLEEIAKDIANKIV